MSCKPSKILVCMVSLAIFATGCTSSKPMYLRDTGDLSYYIDQATSVEYPDVETATLDEVTQSRAPITVVDPDFDNFYDLTLEDCVSMALQNAKVLRGFGTPSLQGTRVSPGVDNLVNGPAAAGTIYNVAVRQTEPGFIGQPGQISAPASITTNTGLESNQGVEAALADFDAQFTSSILFNKSDEARNTITTNPFQPSVFQQDSWQWNSEIAKKTANGTQIFFRNITNYTANNIPTPAEGGFQTLDSFYRTAFEAEFRQPLLRGRGAFIQRMPIVISRIGTDQEIANLEAQLQNMITNIEIRYWELHCAYRNLDAAKTGRAASLQTYRIVQDQFKEGGDVNKQQVAQAAEQYHFFDAQVIDALQSVLSSESNIRWLLGFATTDGAVIRPIDDPVMAPLEFDWCASLAEALSFRPEIRMERWEVKKRELALAYSKNSLLPELNATVLYRWLGNGNFLGTSNSGDLPFPDPSSGALNELYTGNYQEIQFGADFRMPIGYRRELANVRNAQTKLARELARIEDMELDVSRELADALRALKANERIMQSAFNRWKETTIEADHFKELADEGLETLDVALDAQRRRSQSEIAFHSALCEYNKVIALIHRRKGTTLAYSGVQFAEGQWSGKAYQDAHENARRRGASRQLNYGFTRPNVISRGAGGPSNSNPGISSANAGGSGTSTISSPTIYSDTITAPGEFIPTEGTFDSSIPVDGTPYYTPGSQIPTPAIQGSSSRLMRDDSVRQVSYESTARLAKPAKRTQPKRAATTKAKLKPTNISTHNSTANRNTNPIRDNGTNQARISRAIAPTRQTAVPQRDVATAPIGSTLALARRLKPTARALSQAQPQNPIRRNSKNVEVTNQVRKATGTKSYQPSRTTEMNWEKFGLTRPQQAQQSTQVKIKQNRP